MENVGHQTLSLDARITKGEAYDIINIGDTKVAFRLWPGRPEGKYLELVFNASEKEGEGPLNVQKLCLGLLGFYRWANSEIGKDVVRDAGSTCGATNSKFYRTLESICEKGGHTELFITLYDGSANIYAGIDANKFAALLPKDPLIEYLEKIEKRSNFK